MASRLQGRLLVFQVMDSKLTVVTEREVKGAVYNVNAFRGGVLAGINSRVQLFKWTQKVNSPPPPASSAPHCRIGAAWLLAADSRPVLLLVIWLSGQHPTQLQDDTSKELQPECSHVGHILALHVAVRGDFIVVGKSWVFYGAADVLPSLGGVLDLLASVWTQATS